MKTAALFVFVLLLLVAGAGGGWVAMNYFNPGTVGTPVHAGSVSQGSPEECTNLNFHVKPRSTVERTINLPGEGLVRGTFEAQGGFGHVDIFLRIKDPQGSEILASPRLENYEFSFPLHIHGEYTFVFDNRFSLYTAKAVGLFYCVGTGASTPIDTFFPQPQQ